MPYQKIPNKYTKIIENLNINFCYEKIINKENFVICYLPKKNLELRISTKAYPILCRMLIQNQKSKNTVSKTEKFLIAYKIYEILEKNRKTEYSSIRHAISHESSRLSRKKTIKTLNNLFGTTNIDFTNIKHNKIFYKYFINMIIDIDKALYKTLTSK